MSAIEVVERGDFLSMCLKEARKSKAMADELGAALVAGTATPELIDRCNRQIERMQGLITGLIGLKFGGGGA